PRRSTHGRRTPSAARPARTSRADTASMPTAPPVLAPVSKYDWEHEGRRRVLLPWVAGEGLVPLTRPGIAAKLHPGLRVAHRDGPRPVGRSDEDWRRRHQGYLQRQGGDRRQAAARRVHLAG